MPNLHPALRNELEWAIGEISEHGNPEPHQLDEIHRAIRANSPILAKRFQRFLDNSHPIQVEREEKMRLGSLLLALEAAAKGEFYRLYQPGEYDGPDDGKQTTVIQIRCPLSWKARLQAYCQRSGQDMSSLIRKSVEAHLEGNPLWRSSQDE